MDSPDRFAEPLPGDPGLPQAQRLAGKVAIVSGAGSRPAGPDGPIVGNGRATAIVLAREGAKVVLLDQQRAWVEPTLDLIERDGGEAILVEADVTSSASCRAAVERAIEAFGAVNILVNNVGVTGPPGNAVEVDDEAFDRAMRVNVTSMVLMAKYAIPAMIEAGGGAIVNLSSVSGMLGGHPSLLYPTSKTAVIGLTRSMAAHHALQGIRVNCICPGTVYTPMVASRGMTPELREARRMGTLLQVEGTPWDVAMAAAFLVSDAARWITGIALPVDAGATAARLQALSPRSDGGEPDGAG
jgi:NAD(P)-dependent dehydrogenase (short-subunit alcohol dehydrogenase family)